MMSIVYASSAVKPFSKQDLVDLLTKSRENNARSGVTGMLLYKDGNFMQALEGEEDAVEAVHARILKDPRHRGILTLLTDRIEAREFTDWSMGFYDLSTASLASLPGYSRFLNTRLTAGEFTSDPGLSRRLLLTFKRSM